MQDIQWDKLKTAYGFATNIPAILEQLASDHESVFSQGIEEYYAHVFHQSCTIYEVTPYTIPFLLECLRGTTSKKKKRWLIDMFSHLIDISNVQKDVYSERTIDEIAKGFTAFEPVKDMNKQAKKLYELCKQYEEYKRLRSSENG